MAETVHSARQTWNLKRAPSRRLVSSSEGSFSGSMLVLLRVELRFLGYRLFGVKVSGVEGEGAGWRHTSKACTLGT